MITDSLEASRMTEHELRNYDTDFDTGSEHKSVPEQY